MTTQRPISRSRRRAVRSPITLVFAGAVVAVTGTLAATAGSTSRPLTVTSRAAFALHVQQTVGRLMTGPAQAALAMTATGTRDWSPGGATPAPGTAPSAAQAPATVRETKAAGRGLANVRVNDPGEDRHFVDQTTQSEPTIAVAGQNVVVGYNDSQTSLPGVFTAGLDLTGYSYSTDGGETFTDGGELPNKPGFNNLGDPWVGAGRGGDIYFSNLIRDDETGNVDVGVAKSTDGGKTFSTPTIVSPHERNYFGDKPALAVGPNATRRPRDTIYVTWDDVFVDRESNQFSGLPVARSMDGGHSWHVAYAEQTPTDPDSCSYTQYIGATPAVDPNGLLYVVAEKASVDDPDCTGESPFVLSEAIFKSTDGGKTFAAGREISAIHGVENLRLGHGRVMRTGEFPAIAIDRKGTVFVAWNDSRSLGHSDIRLATSTDGGSTWNVAWATGGRLDHLQPALSADGDGVHVLYYQRNRGNTLDVLVADSKNGRAPFAVTRVTSRSFPGVFTVPQFDPVMGDAYMGDHIASVSDGRHQYFAWGDNRDRVMNVLWPKGRHDPNVYLAKR